MVCYLKVFPERTDNFGCDNYNEQPRYLYKKKKNAAFFRSYNSSYLPLRCAKPLSLSLSLICTVVSTSCDFLQPISSPRHSYKGELFVPLVQCVSTGRCPAERFIARNKLFPAKSSLITKRQSLCFHTLRRGTSAMFVYPSSVCFPHFSLSLLSLENDEILGRFCWRFCKVTRDENANNVATRQRDTQKTAKRVNIAR